MGIYAPIRDFCSALMAADPAALAQAFTDSPTIIDDIPRHYWSGPDAVALWFADARRVGGQRGPGQLEFRLLQPLYADVHGDDETPGSSAYAAMPAKYSVSGETGTQHGEALCTFTLQRGEQDWKIQSWTFNHTGAHRRPINPGAVGVWDG